MNITVYWAGPSDADTGDTYKVERSLNFTDWTQLAAAQAATSPYVSPTTTLDGAHTVGTTTIDLVDASSFSTSGQGLLDRSIEFSWDDKTGNQLTGVRWLSGDGTYTDGSEVHELHESYADAGVTPTDYAVVYRITRTNDNGEVSPPLVKWFYTPPVPESTMHCVLIVAAHADLGISPQSGIQVKCYLTSDDQFSEMGAGHLDKDNVLANTQTTNDLGLAFFQCWKDAYRFSVSGSEVAYEVTIDSDDTTNRAFIGVDHIPDKDWVLLKHLT